MINGFSRYDFVTGGIVAVVSILMVFLILVLIIFLTELVAKAMGNDEKEEETVVEAPVTPVVSHLDLNDEYATVAALVASIDYRNKTKKNIRVVSIREVK